MLWPVRDELDHLWEASWSGTPPVGHLLRGAHADRWVRFHMLPGSKRYPDSEDEDRVILARHHELLGVLGLTGRVRIGAAVHRRRAAAPESGPSRSDSLADAPDPLDEEVQLAVYAATMTFPSEAVDDVLRAVADEKEVGVIIAPPDAPWLYHPYDGAADVIAASPEARDRLAEGFRDWLSAHPSGR